MTTSDTGLRADFARFRAALAAPPKPDALAWLLLSALLIGLDQWTKLLALQHLEPGERVPVIEGFWNWTLHFNPGASFGMLADAGGAQIWLFGGLAVLISLALSLWLRVTPRADWRTALPLALVISGALGNLIDRLRIGKVVDFIDWHIGEKHWPAFNVADSAIVVGAILLVLFSFRAGSGAAKGG
jgi:signal peptidase II